MRVLNINCWLTVCCYVSEVKFPPFSYSVEPDAATLHEFCNLASTGNPTWVRKDRLNALKKEASSLKEYSAKLMWDLLMPEEDFILAREHKQQSVGFAKLLGKERIQAIYGRFPYLERALNR